MNAPGSEFSARGYFFVPIFTVLFMVALLLQCALVGRLAFPDEHETVVSQEDVALVGSRDVSSDLSRTGRAKDETVYIESETTLMVDTLYQDQTVVLNASLIVGRGFNLSFIHCNIVSQDNLGEKILKSEREARLYLDDVKITLLNGSNAAPESRLTIESRGFLFMTNVDLEYYQAIHVFDSEAYMKDVNLHNSTNDGVYFKSSKATLQKLSVHSSGQSGMNLAFSTVEVRDFEIQDAKESGIYLMHSVLNQTGTLVLKAKFELDLGDSAIFNTVEPGVEFMDIEYRDKNSRIVIWEDGKEIKTLKQEDSRTNVEKALGDGMTLYMGGTLVVVVLVVLMVKKTTIFTKKSKVPHFDYLGENLETFPTDTDGKSSEDNQTDTLFVFGMMALNAGNHDGALSYFSKVLSLCTGHEEKYRFLSEINRVLQQKPEAQPHYISLLTQLPKLERLVKVRSKVKPQQSSSDRFGSTRTQQGSTAHLSSVGISGAGSSGEAKNISESDDFFEVEKAKTFGKSFQRAFKGKR